MPKPIPFLWTNDDITTGKYDSLARILDFLAPFNIKGTFFVVPRWKAKMRLTDDPKVIELLKQATRDGHEAHQHSTTHHCEENGTADLLMYDLMDADAKAIHSRQRFPLERIWQVDALMAQIDWGRQEWIAAFGAPSIGFRPGCGAFCRNMYTALENLGFQWVSSKLVSATGWQWAAKNYNYPVQWENTGMPNRIGKLIEISLLDDVAFRIPQDKIDLFVELGWKHWQHCVEHGWPYVLVSHPFALEHDEGTGFAIHQKLLPRILDSGLALPMTGNEYFHRVQAGEFPLASREESYPDSDAIPEWHVMSQAQTRSRA